MSRAEELIKQSPSAQLIFHFQIYFRCVFLPKSCPKIPQRTFSAKLESSNYRSIPTFSKEIKKIVTRLLTLLSGCSKPLNYAIALDKLGPDVVHSYVGQEPSGRNFNELILDYNSKSVCFSRFKVLIV